MTDYGITPEGFRAKTLREINDEIAQDQHDDINPNLDTSETSPDGQRNAIVARQLALVWEGEQTIYEATDPDKAEDDQLISLCKLTGTVPRAAGYSSVKCNVDADFGTVLTPDVTFAAVDGKPEILFTPVSEFTAPSDGVHTGILWRAAVAGPVQAFAGTLTVKNTTESGWNSITNPLDAVEGTPADTNETLRARREEELAKAGSSTVRAIRADVLNLTDEDGNKVVQSCDVLENDTDYVNGDGLPPHSLEVVLYDSPALDDDVIAQALFDDGAAGGISMVGSSSGNATDEQGTIHVRKFTRPAERAIWIEYDLTTDSKYPGDTAFKAAVAPALRAIHKPGGDVLRAICEREAWKVAGITNVVSVKLGFSASPTLSADLAIGAREIATFDTTRITRT